MIVTTCFDRVESQSQVHPALMQVVELVKLLHVAVENPVQPDCHRQPCWLPQDAWLLLNVEQGDEAPVQSIPMLS
jgi:hypothetical protein